MLATNCCDWHKTSVGSRADIRRQAFHRPLNGHRRRRDQGLLQPTTGRYAVLASLPTLHNILLQAFLSPLDGIIDAVSDAINARRSVPPPDSRFGIQDSDGDPLNTGRLLSAALRIGVSVVGAFDNILALKSMLGALLVVWAPFQLNCLCFRRATFFDSPRTRRSTRLSLCLGTSGLCRGGHGSGVERRKCAEKFDSHGAAAAAAAAVQVA